MEKFEIVDCVLVKYNGNEEDILIPSNVKIIGNSSFSENNNIKTVTINEGVKVIEEEAFSYCEKLEQVILPSTLKTIKSHAFLDCKNLSSINLPINLEEIDSHAFFNTSLKEIVIPSSLKTIGFLAFGGLTPIEKIEVEEESKTYKSIDGVLFNKEGTSLLMFPNKYKKCDYTIPSTVKTIASYAFSGVLNKVSIKMNEGVKSIKERAFFASLNCGDLYLQNSIEEIGKEAFDAYGLNSSGVIHVEKNSKISELLKENEISFIEE